MYNISNMVNWFMGLCIDNQDISISEKIDKAQELGMEEIKVVLPVESIQYECESVPKQGEVDDINARYIVKCAYMFAHDLVDVRLSDIEEDIEYVFFVLEVIAKKTSEYMFKE